MAYPTDIPSFTPISGTTLVASDDHSNRHNTEGSAITALANTLGTTAGTSIAKDFTAGDFATRVNSGGTLQQQIFGTMTIMSGTINGALLGTPIVRSWDGWQEANETWTCTGVDGTVYTGTITVSADVTAKYSRGMKTKFTQGGTVIKGFISGTPSAASGTTTMTLYTGTAYTMGTTAITSNYYSLERSPYGFDLNPSKWAIEVTNTNTTNQGTPTNQTWYNVGTINTTIPIGEWITETAGAVYGFDTGGVALMQVYVTLSTANNTEADKEFTAYAASRSGFGTGVSEVAGPFYKRKILDLSSKSQRFMNVKSEASSIDDVGLVGSNVTTILRVTPVWL